MGGQWTTQLATAMKERRLVCLQRRDGGETSGYVLAVGPEFVLVARVLQWRFEAFSCLRLSHIEDVGPDSDSEFILAVLAKRGEAIPAKPPIDVHGAGELLISASRAFPLVTIHCFPEDLEDCKVGQVVRVQGREFTLREVGPNAQWRDEEAQYQLDDVWRVSVDGNYERALHLVAGDPPSRDGAA